MNSRSGRLPALSPQSRLELLEFLDKRGLRLPTERPISPPPLLLREPDLRAGALAQWVDGSASTVELDIGSSWGEFLCKIAARYPHKKYLGVEIRPAKCARAFNRAMRTGVSNVCIVNMEAHRFIQEFICADFLSAIHIYFPTPDQRSLGDTTLPQRLITYDFVRLAYRALRSSCSVRLMTDQRNYADHMTEMFVAPFWNRKTFLPLELGQKAGLFADTPLEYQYHGRRQIQRLEFEKLSTNALLLYSSRGSR